MYGDATNEVINAIDLRARIISKPSVVLYWWADIDLSTHVKESIITSDFPKQILMK